MSVSTWARIYRWALKSPSKLPRTAVALELLSSHRDSPYASCKALGRALRYSASAPGASCNWKSNFSCA